MSATNWQIATNPDDNRVPPTPETQLTGNVTLDGNPVSGFVVFLGSDKIPKEAPINTEGKYILPPLPQGKSNESTGEGTTFDIKLTK